MEKYLKIIVDGFTGYWNYLTNELLYPSWHNYFYWLVGLSLFSGEENYLDSFTAQMLEPFRHKK